ncbi:MAG: serine/threonine protein kinase [Verrucomicrobiales bacterium]
MSLPRKFTNVRQLGPGKNAKVFSATNSYLQREVFLKVYPIPASDSLSALKEPQLLQELEHPNLTKIYSADPSTDDQILLEIELIDGGSFKDIIDEAVKTATWPAVHYCLDLIQDAAAGLSHLHAHGYVHRDIKPANLVVKRSRGRPHGLVTDLGFASKLNDSGRAFASQHSRLYRPPEVWSGAGYSVASDVYQLGLVLFQLLGGSLDHSLANLSDSDLFTRVAASKLVVVDSVGAHVSDSLLRVIRACICGENQRISSISDLVVGLNNVKAKHPNWRLTWGPHGFRLDRKDASGMKIKVEVKSAGHTHTVQRSKGRGNFRAIGDAGQFTHRNLGRCRKFRQFIEL